jgi:NAD(P)-dependent dehydrogenase (short-subunit alcohol dehydrogenase family)
MGSGAGIGGMGSGVSGNTGNLVLVTGGAGYIGSHCCIDLLQAGYDVVVVSETNNNKFSTERKR